MSLDISNKWKSSFILLLKKYFSWFKKKIKIIGIAIFFSVVCISIPSLIFHLKTDKNEIEKKIRTFISSSELTLSYDGVSIRGYNDIVFINVRASLYNASRSRNILTVPELIISPNLFKSWFTHSLVIKKITFADARWKYWANENQLNKKIINSVNEYLKKNPDFQIELKSNLFTVIFEKQNYERETWNILSDSGNLESEKGKIQLYLHYNDAPWGKGDLAYSPSMCDQCSLFHGDYKVNLINFPVNRMSWFFQDFKLTSGFIDLKAEIANHYSGKKESTNAAEKFNEVTIKSFISFTDLSVIDNNKNAILENDRFRVELGYQQNQLLTSVDYSGDWNKSQFNGQYIKNHQSLWPEKFKFLLDNHRNYSLPLFYGYRLDGLREIQIDMGEDKDNKTYRNINGKLSISSGKLRDSGKRTILEIPELILNMDNNNFKGKIDLKKVHSDFQFEFSGNINPYKKNIETQIEYNDYKKNETLELNDIAFEINETGKITSENISWPDVSDYYKTLKGEWDKNINSDQFKGWRPSILRERIWFQKYFLRTSIDNEITIKNWKQDLTEKESLLLSGYLKYINGVAEFSLTGDKQNYYFAIDANSSYPLIRGEYKLDFKSPNDFSLIWLPPGLIGKFNQMNIEYKYATSGEHPADISENYNGSGIFTFQNVILAAVDKNTSGNWSKLNMDIRNYPGKININLTGERDEATMTAWGNYEEKDHSSWDIKSSLYTKR